MACICPAHGQESEPGPSFSIRGLAFGDLYGVASHHDSAAAGSAGAVLRRGYLTADVLFSDRLEARVRLELNQAGEFETYNYELDFKDLYLRWHLRRQSITFGLSPTPTFDFIEGFWGLRYLMRTPLDLQGVASRDTGVAAQGPLNGSGTLRYRAMVGAGAEFGSEAGDGRKWMGALNWQTSDLVVDVYVDYEFLGGDTDRTTLQGFVGYRTEPFRWGLQYARRIRQDAAPIGLFSTFLVASVQPDSSVVFRVDRLSAPSPKGDNIAYIPFDPTAPATMFLLGLEFRVDSLFTITPNSVIIAYDRDEEGNRPGTDALLRLTFFIDLE